MKLNLQSSRELYYEASGSVSEISRQLGYAGIAIIWLFRTESPDELSIPKGLTFAIISIVGFFILDLAQYVSKSTIWGIFQRQKEKDILEKGLPNEFLAPSWFPKVPLFFFVTKLIFISLAYLTIFFFLASKISFS